MSLDQNNLMDTLRKLAADTSTDPNVLALVGKNRKMAIEDCPNSL